MVECHAEMVALAQALQERHVDAIGLQHAVELVEAAERIVALERDIPAEPPPRRQRENTAGLDAAAPAIEQAPLLGRHLAGQCRAVLLDAGELEIVLTANVADGDPLAPLPLIQHAVLRRVHRMEREVGAGRQREIVGHLDGPAERGRGGVFRQQEAGATFHRRIGVREEGQVEHRHAQDLELGILVVDRPGLLVVDDARGADAPQRRLARIVLARRELAALELRDIGVLPRRALRDDARVVARDRLKRLDEGVAEIGRGIEAVGAQDVAVRLAHLHVARRRQRIRRLIVDDLIGRQRVVVVVDLDIAARHDAIVFGVVDEVVALQVKRLRLVDLLHRAAENAALLLREAALFLLLAGRRERIESGLRRRLAEQACKQRQQRQDGKRANAAPPGLPPQRRQARQSSLASPTTRHRHPSSWCRSTVKAPKQATSAGTHTARTGGARPAMPTCRETSARRKNPNPPTIPAMTIVCIPPERNDRKDTVAAKRTITIRSSGRARSC